MSSPASAPQERVRLLNEKLGVRFTLIRLDGSVAADSDKNPFKMDNHAERPEILAERSPRVGSKHPLQQNPSEKDDVCRST